MRWDPHSILGEGLGHELPIAGIHRGNVRIGGTLYRGPVFSTQTRHNPDRCKRDTKTSVQRQERCLRQRSGTHPERAAPGLLAFWRPVLRPRTGQMNA